MLVKNYLILRHHYFFYPYSKVEYRLDNGYSPYFALFIGHFKLLYKDFKFSSESKSWESLRKHGTRKASCVLLIIITDKMKHGILTTLGHLLANNHQITTVEIICTRRMSPCISRRHNKMVVVLTHYSMNTFILMCWCLRTKITQTMKSRPALWQVAAPCSLFIFWFLQHFETHCNERISTLYP